MLKAEGMLSGVPDIILPVARKGFNGLMIEFKKPVTGRLTGSQQLYIDLVVKENWLVVVMTDAQAAIDTVKNYLAIK